MLGHLKCTSSSAPLSFFSYSVFASLVSRCIGKDSKRLLRVGSVNENDTY